MNEDLDLIEEFDKPTSVINFPDAPLNLPTAPISLPSAPKTSKEEILFQVIRLYHKMYVKYITTNCPKDKATRMLNEDLKRSIKNYNESIERGGSKKTRVNKTKKTKRNMKYPIATKSKQHNTRKR
jgi:hypothetical protein